MAKRMSAADKVLNDEFVDSYRRVGYGAEVDIFDLGNLKAEALTAAKSGTPMDEAVKAVLSKYRKN